MCKGCGPLRAEVERLTALLAESERNAADAMVLVADERDEMQRLIRSQSGYVQSMKRELNDARANEPQAGDITEILEAWRRLLGHPKCAIPLSGSRAAAVRKMLKVYEALAKEQEAENPKVEAKAALMEALEGLALYPIDAGYGRHVADGKVGKRRDEVEYVFANETRVEKFRKLYRDARLMSEARPEMVDAIYAQVSATADVWRGLLLESLGRETPVGILELRQQIEGFEVAA
jgi:hypothetical protein